MIFLFMELLLMIDAAKRASAKSIIAVMPYFGWARQDRKDKPRVSIAAKLVADLLSTAGVDRVITMDLHADQIQGFFNVPVDHLYASSVFIPYIQSLNLEDMVIATPDVGGAKRANSYAKYLDLPLVLCHKQRAKANVVANMTVIGDVKDKIEQRNGTNEVAIVTEVTRTEETATIAGIQGKEALLEMITVNPTPLELQNIETEATEPESIEIEATEPESIETEPTEARVAEIFLPI